MVEYTGSLVGGTLPVALLMFSGAGETGTLSLGSDLGAARFLFSSGKLVYARTESGPRLGDALVSKGLVKQEDLDKVLHLQGRKKVRQPLGVLLHSFGLISREQAQSELEEQVLTTIREVCAWEKCQYRFEPLEEPFDELLLPGTGDVNDILERLG